MVENGHEMAVGKGDPITIRLDYYHGNDKKDVYPVEFTATINTNDITGTAKTFDTQIRYGGGGLAEGGIKDVPLDTSSAPFTSAQIIINVTSDATGTEILATCDFTLTVLPPDGDEDGDGLLNRWELKGIDANHDGIIDLHLFGAEWNHKDLFVEVDIMSGHEPHPNVFQNVMAAFAAAPVENPGDQNGQSGIALHIVKDEVIPARPSTILNMDLLNTVEGIVEIGSPPIECTDWNACSFDRIKLGEKNIPCDGYFGTQQERQAPDCELKLQARRMVFRYVVFVNEIADGRVDCDRPNCRGGMGEMPGNDFIVVACAPNWQCLDQERESNTFMHELGHTLGLSHGGAIEDAETNCKPNYLSVMNYTNAGKGTMPVNSRWTTREKNCRA
jgi:hypothetical protein